MVLDGKATLQIVRTSDGLSLYNDGNATFRLVGIDTGANSGIGYDKFAIKIWDKNGATYHFVGAWGSGTSNQYVDGELLKGGNIVAHAV